MFGDAGTVFSPLERRVLVLDGASGTMRLQTRLPAAARHDSYLDAGADIISTDTFQVLSCEGSRKAAGRARAAADAWSRRTPGQPRLVAGVSGPSPASSFDAIRDGYRGQLRGLIDGGVDLLLLETTVDTLSARAWLAAVEAAQRGQRQALPVWVSAVATDAGLLLSGETLDTFVEAIEGAKPAVVGINCGTGAIDTRPHLDALARRAGNMAVAWYPSAGLPDAFGQYDEPLDATVRLLVDAARAGLVDVVGGCCGTSPELIRELAKAVRDAPPRLRPTP